jgi:hypothetical protein
MIPSQFEPTAPVVVAVVLATLIWNVLGYAVARRLRPEEAPTANPRDASGGDAPRAESVEDGRSSAAEAASRVRCPDCGTPNEDGYRYCRECLAELPDAPSFARSDGPPAGRLIR